MQLLRTQLGGSNLPCRGQEAPQRALLRFSLVRDRFVNREWSVRAQCVDRIDARSSARGNPTGKQSKRDENRARAGER